MRLQDFVSGGQKVLEKNLHPLSSSSIPYELEPEEIVKVITELIGWYQRRRSTQLALLITQYIEMLLVHPEIENLEMATLCQHRQLQKHWEYIVSAKHRN